MRVVIYVTYNLSTYEASSAKHLKTISAHPLKGAIKKNLGGRKPIVPSYAKHKERTSSKAREDTTPVS